MSHMEWFRRPDGRIAVGEVGARPPGSRIFTARTGPMTTVYNAWIRLMTLNSSLLQERKIWRAGLSPRHRDWPGSGGTRSGCGAPRLRTSAGRNRPPCLGQVRANHHDGEGYLMLRHRETGGRAGDPGDREPNCASKLVSFQLTSREPEVQQPAPAAPTANAPGKPNKIPPIAAGTDRMTAALVPRLAA